MATVETKTAYTPDDLLHLQDSKGFELVDGELVEKPVSALSSWVGGRLFSRVSNHNDAHSQGLVWPQETGIQCFPDDPDRVRKPDLSFVTWERLPPDWLEQGFLRIVPDLTAEVISPKDLVYEVDEKVHEYRTAGVRLIWVVNPEQRTVRIHRKDGSFGWLEENDTLDGEDVLPGFRCPVRELFPEINKLDLVRQGQ